MKTKIAKRLISAILTVAMLLSVAITASASVTDVKPSNWAYTAVQYNVSNKLIAVDLTKYQANNPAPRQDVAYALYKILNGKDNEPSSAVTNTVAKDMTNSASAYKYSVGWCMDNGIIAGIGGGKFGPTNIVTREQMATLLFRTAQYQGLETNNYGLYQLYSFDDGTKASDWARNAMAWCISNKLMAGTGNNKLSPKATLTYAQLAQFAMNYCKLAEKQLGTTPSETPAPSETPKPTPTPVVTGNSGSYYNQTAHPENANKTAWLEDYVITDLSGPWDNVREITELPVGGYVKNGHRYNVYGVCIDTVDGIPTDYEKKALILINQHRLNNGLKALEWDQSVQVIAETRAIEGYKQHTDNTSAWAHVRPNGDYHNTIINEWTNIGLLKNKQYGSWFYENAAPNWPEPYENALGYHEYTAIDVVKSWINSPGHNDALLSGDNYGAVAYDTTANNRYYWYYDVIKIH